jgi:putative membrane protein
MAESHTLRPDFRRAYILIGALLLAGAVLSLVIYFGTDFGLFAAAPFLLIALFSAAVVAYILITTASYSYEMGSEELVMNQGILNKTSRSVPVSNIDNVTVNRTMLDRILGVGDICIDTPGGTGYELVLKHVEAGMLKEVVDELKSHMKEHRGGIKRNE